jgi:NAD-dependent SIR2 family protein deacetylase
MKDIFDNKIICNDCNHEMKLVVVPRNGFNLRIMKCDKCGQTIIHPGDKVEYENFIRLKEKEFNVKMRMVGNSYAVSIPKEIVDFMKEQESKFNEMVRLSLDQMGKVSLMFNSPESRVVSSKEIKIVKNGKPVLHARKFSDSAHPERTKTKVFKTNDFEEE